MIVRLELDTAKPEDRAILALVFGTGAAAPAPAPPENAATDELVEGRDALRGLVVRWQALVPSGRAPEFGFFKLDMAHWPALVGYVAACQGLVAAAVAVWDESTTAIGPEVSAQREAMARDFAAQLVFLAESMGLRDLDPWRNS